MSEKDAVLKAVRAAFEHELWINLHKYPVQMDFADGVLTLEGEMETIAAKKLGMELAIKIPGVTGIVDRLHVVPASRMGDREILNAVCDVLMREPGLQGCTIQSKAKGRLETIRESPLQSKNGGNIIVSVEDGVVLLDDHVPSLAQKRLAGVLAWWVPGSRDVVNGMAVEPPEEDSDDEITDTVRMILERDPLVNAARILVRTSRSVVTLEGLVINEAQKNMAEFDAWYVFGVDKVINNLTTQE